MKKIISVILIAVISIILGGCGNSVRDADVGDVVAFGKYDNKSLTWVVLAVNGKRKLLLLNNAFGRQMYDEADRKVTWTDCSLRKFLNGKFYNEVIAEIQDIDIINVERRTGIFDKVFVLNEREVKEYLNEKKYIQATPIHFDTEYDAWVNNDNGFTRYLLDNVNDEKIRYVDSNGQIVDGMRKSRYAVRPAILVGI